MMRVFLAAIAVALAAAVPVWAQSTSPKLGVRPMPVPENRIPQDARGRKPWGSNPAPSWYVDKTGKIVVPHPTEAEHK